MYVLVPYDGSTYAREALREACRIVSPIDTIVAMAHVRANAVVRPTRQDEAYYRRRSHAELALADAMEHAGRFGHYGALLRTLQVEAPNRWAAIVAAAEIWPMDRIILTLPVGWYGQLLLLLHPLLRALIREAPCPVQFTFLRTAHRTETRSARRIGYHVSEPAPDREFVPRSTVEEDIASD